MMTTHDETRPVSTTPDESRQPEPVSTSTESAPTPIIEEMIVSDQAKPKRRGCARVWVFWTLIALMLLCVIAGLSGWGGYRAGNPPGELPAVAS
jgi:hypothetical protein